MKTNKVSDVLCRTLKKCIGAKVRRVTTLPSCSKGECRMLYGPGEEEIRVGLTEKETDLWKHTWPAVYLYRLENVFCTGDQGTIFFDREQLFAVCPSLERLPNKKVRLPVISRADLIEEPVFHLSGFSPENHGHYLFHHLPRFLAALKLLQDNPNIKILCSHGHSRWQGKYLAKLGISPDRLLETSTGTLKFRELYYVPVTMGSYKLGVPEYYRLMHQSFAGNVSQEKRGVPIWVSRLDAPDKKLRNEEKLIECVRDIFGGVEVVELSKRNMEQQVKLFADARFIFGALGQGLANILYCKDSVLVILAMGKQEVPVHASLMTGVAGAMVGNRAVFLNSDTSYVGKHREWYFSESKFCTSVLAVIDEMKKVGRLT
jgi:hypothetical protein